MQMLDVERVHAGVSKWFVRHVEREPGGTEELFSTRILACHILGFFRFCLLKYFYVVLFPRVPCTDSLRHNNFFSSLVG